MLKKILAVIALVAIVIVGTVTYLYLKPTATASQPIEAIPLGVQTDSAINATPSEATITDETIDITEDVTESVSEDVAEAMIEESITTATTESSVVLFEIISSESEARFIIDEVLNGTPATVVGTTDQVAGQLAVDTANVDNTQIGVIQINARTLTTDNNFRNLAIGNRILYTDDHEYITFTPTAISGLPENVNVGDAFTFQITGDLTIREVTEQVTFDMQVTAVDEDRLVGSAATTIQYADFDINIPTVPSVTDVSDTVSLEFDFVAGAI